MKVNFYQKCAVKRDEAFLLFLLFHFLFLLFLLPVLRKNKDLVKISNGHKRK